MESVVKRIHCFKQLLREGFSHGQHIETQLWAIEARHLPKVAEELSSICHMVLILHSWMKQIEETECYVTALESC